MAYAGQTAATGALREEKEMGLLKGKVAIVSGIGPGLGRATALKLAEAGANVVLAARTEARLAEVADEVRALGVQALAVPTDLAEPQDCEALVEKSIAEFGRVDVLVNNAGALFNPRSETIEGLEQSFALLLLSPYCLTEGLKPLLLMASSPRVVNVVSGGMYSESLNIDELIVPDTDAYSGSVAYARQKRALMVLTQEWAAEWESEGIVVNAMHPGWADTPGVRSALPQFRKITKHVLRSSEEGADTIVWLAVATEAGSVSGKLFLDRAEHSTHLVNKTRETRQETEKLMRFLASNSLSADVVQ